MHWVYYFGRFLIRILVFTVASWEVKGRENVPKQGPLLIVCNHLHIADPPIVAASIPLKSVLMAKEELFQQRWSRFWVKNFGAFPVRRGGADREAFRQAEHWLKRGVSLIMFPEGTRSSQAQLIPALPGAALIASRLRIPILPVGITGTEKFRNLTWCFFHHPKISISIGRPFNPPSTNGKLTRAELDKLSNSIMEHIANLLPTKYQGVYARGESLTHQPSGKSLP